MPILKFISELIITALELFGMVFVAIGLGLFAAWLTGTAGFFTVTGVALLGAAYCAAQRQATGDPQVKTKTTPPSPVTRNAAESNGTLPKTDTVGMRIRKVFRP